MLFSQCYLDSPPSGSGADMLSLESEQTFVMASTSGIQAVDRLWNPSQWSASPARHMMWLWKW